MAQGSQVFAILELEGAADDSGTTFDNDASIWQPL